MELTARCDLSLLVALAERAVEEADAEGAADSVEVGLPPQVTRRAVVYIRHKPDPRFRRLSTAAGAPDILG